MVRSSTTHCKILMQTLLIKILTTIRRQTLFINMCEKLLVHLMRFKILMQALLIKIFVNYLRQTPFIKICATLLIEFLLQG